MSEETNNEPVQIAVLNPVDLAVVNRDQEILLNQARVLELLKISSIMTWKQLADKYDLPATYTYSRETGVVFTVLAVEEKDNG